MSQKLRGIPLGVKIFGMVASMLVLLVAVVGRLRNRRVRKRPSI